MNQPVDKEELGRGLSAARGYAGMSRPKFHEASGISESASRRYESGLFGETATDIEVRQIAEKYIRATGCPAHIVFGQEVPSEVAAAERMTELEKTVAKLMERIDDFEMRLNEQDAGSVIPKGSTNNLQTSEQKHGASS